MPKKKITNEVLAKMIKRGFDDHDKRFDDHDKRFEGANKRFDKIDSRFDKIDLKLGNLEQGHDEIKVRLDNVAYRFEVEDLQRRVKKLEFKLGIRRA
jgi:archaellum component FlaC